MINFLKNQTLLHSDRGYFQPIFVGLVFLVWFSVLAFLRPLALPDEGRYVGIAWEMLRSGNYLVPTLNGAPYFHKPPLFYWLTAFSLGVFGLNEAAARIAPILGAWVGAFALYLFMRRWSQSRSIFAVLFILCIHPFYYLGAQYANMDMLVAGCITATILLLAHSVLLIEYKLPYRYSLAAAYGMAGLGFLAKGLIGFVLPALVVIVWLVVVRRFFILFRLIWWPGLVLFASIVMPWLISMQRAYPNFFDYFFVTQHFNRFAKTGFNNALPFWFYPVVLGVGSMLWLPWLWSFFRSKLISTFSTQEGKFTEQSIYLLMVLWIGVITLFFSIPTSKLLGYILPVVPPLAFLIGTGFSHAAYPIRFKQVSWWGAIFIALLLNISAIWVTTFSPRDSTKNIAQRFVQKANKAQPLFMLNHYFFDFPFYASLANPVIVVNDWKAEMEKQTDGQARELMDTVFFDQRQTSHTLLPKEAWTSTLCRHDISWVMSFKDEKENYPFLGLAQLITTDLEIALWKIDISDQAMANALHCRDNKYEH